MNISENLKYWYEQTNIGLYRSSTDKKIKAINVTKASCEKIIHNHQNSNIDEITSVIKIEIEKIEILETILDILIDKQKEKK